MPNSYELEAAEKALSDIKMSPSDIRRILPVLMKMYQFEMNRVEGYEIKELVGDLKRQSPLEIKERVLKFAGILRDIKNDPINDLFMSLRKAIRECNTSISEIEKNARNPLLEDRPHLNGLDTKLYNSLTNSYIEAKAIFTQISLGLTQNDPKRSILLDADKMISAIAFSISDSKPIQKIRERHEMAAQLSTELASSTELSL